ncbi:hypothetical protein BDQ12DRAFT_640695 [Crucibulum laeve]|uniref:HIT-type domain-containing protein n=1 Tax=Crucibulum laeve TaxID=68775 RepID=A0A5C3MFT6_9AGAR|nr:hypothetical protein BDQ12DRAFT_640695 [Crucibulum laeve]
MPPHSREPAKCQICNTNESKYTCSQCYVFYCSVTCFKKHKADSCTLKTSAERNNNATNAQPVAAQPESTTESSAIKSGDPDDEPPLEEPKQLRPLTSLNWPYVPEESAYPDPLKRDDPKTLQLHQYEAIATSPDIREVLAGHKNLPALLTSIDKLRGPDREHTLQRALGLTAPEIDDQLKSVELSDDVIALRKLAEAVEAAVRGGNQTMLGLDWGE